MKSRHFNKKLYSTVDNVDLDYTNKLQIPKLSEDIKKELDMSISAEELGKALYEMPNEKSPGTDGLPPDFYKCFWGKLKAPYHEMITEVISEGKFHLTARRGILSLLEKVQKNILKLDSWRPLALLNTDNKIFTKALARRMQKTQHLIHESQTGFVKGRHMSANIMRIMEVINHCEVNQESGFLISFDFYKAFDTVEWQTIYHTLRLFNFGEKFIDMVKIIFVDPLICAYNNGFWSEFFSPTRGCRQGCCLSPSLFTYVVEILGLALRQNQNIQGVKVGEEEIKSGQFADDLLATLRPTTENLDATIQEISDFGKYSGLRLNVNKCAVLKLGPCRHTNAKYYTQKKLFWSPKPIRILGVMIFPDWKIMHKANFDDLLQRVDTILSSWLHRSLTLVGKIVVVNNLVNSLFVHKLLALPSPSDQFFRDYKARIVKFLWGDKRPKIAYAKLIQDYDRLGLKLVDLKMKDIALKATWPVRWPEVNNTKWFFHLMPVKNESMWECNLDPKDLANLIKLNPFSVTLKVLEAWLKFHYQPVLETPEEILCTVLYGNSLIKRKNAPIFEVKLLTSNVERILDIYDVTKHRLMTSEELVAELGIDFDPLFYLGLRAAIPNRWKIELRNFNPQEPLDYDTKLDSLASKNAPTKLVYKTLLGRSYPVNTASKIIWENQLNVTWSEEEWWELFPKFRADIKITKLQFFQYRLLIGAVTTNQRVSTWNKDISPLCTFCKQQTETVMHVLINCQKVTELWRNLERMCKHFFQIKLRCTDELIIANNYKGPKRALINQMICIMKHYIYVEKCGNEIPKFTKFMNRLSTWYQIEKCYVLQENNAKCIKRFFEKWNSLF